MTRDVVIIGMGGQGRECLEIALALRAVGHPIRVLGCYDDNPSPNERLLRRRGVAVLGRVEDFLSAPGDAEACIGIGSGGIRSRIDRALQGSGVDSPVLVHPASTVGPDVRLGPGTVVWAGARLTTNISTGRHVHINQNATIGHDARLDDYVSVSPLVAISGNVDVGRGATLGASAVVLPGVQIGVEAVVGAGAVVVRDVQDRQTVKGVPAR